jgi:spermidine synthase
MTKEFLDISQFYPPIINSQRYLIYKSVLTEKELDVIEKNWSKHRNSLYLSKFVIGKEYVILLDKTLNKTMMSNHEFEIITNQKFLDNAKGDVLIFGLGIGLVIFPLLNMSEINSITIVEIDGSLIEHVNPIIKKNDIHSKVSIYEGDAFSFETNKLFDTIYFDIWHSINEKAFREMKILIEKFKYNLTLGGWMDSWCSEEEKFYHESK